MADNMATMNESLELSIVYEGVATAGSSPRFRRCWARTARDAPREEARANVIDALKVMLAGDDESLAARSADTETITPTVGS
ncbi:MAG: hypothetical protein WCD11_17565 [Solirubrobacteraceae bacterium]